MEEDEEDDIYPKKKEDKEIQKIEFTFEDFLKLLGAIILMGLLGLI